MKSCHCQTVLLKIPHIPTLFISSISEKTNYFGFQVFHSKGLINVDTAYSYHLHQQLTRKSLLQSLSQITKQKLDLRLIDRNYRKIIIDDSVLTRTGSTVCIARADASRVFPWHA
jgi:hypothetical protein